MSKIKSIEIKCLNCNSWFSSPIFFGDMETLVSNLTVLTGNEAQCPYCRKMTPCNKENMKVNSEDGGYLGIDT